MVRDKHECGSWIYEENVALLFVRYVDNHSRDYLYYPPQGLGMRRPSGGLSMSIKLLILFCTKYGLSPPKLSLKG